jgi:hypothetical protein
MRTHPVTRPNPSKKRCFSGIFVATRVLVILAGDIRMTHIVGTMASLQALRGSLGNPTLKVNAVAQPPAVLHASSSRPVVVAVPPRKGN